VISQTSEAEYGEDQGQLIGNSFSLPMAARLLVKPAEACRELMDATNHKEWYSTDVEGKGRGEMRSHRSIPLTSDLAAFVHAILVEEDGEADDAAAPYTVLPRPYPVLGLQTRGRLALVQGDTSQQLGPDCLRAARSILAARTTVVRAHRSAS
jgi:hypothetical protein